MSASFWIRTLELITSLSLLVFVHELGHYMWARIFGIKVEKFYLFFNPWFTLFKWHPRTGKVSLFSKNPKEETEDKNNTDKTEKTEEVAALDTAEKQSWRDTEYGIGWVPLGGYCAIAGMIDETKSADDLGEVAQPWEFRSKPAWKRLLVMVGGVLNNFIFAILIYAGMVYYWGEEVLPMKNITMGMRYSQVAHKAGFEDGDIPIKADGNELTIMDNDAVQKLLTSSRVEVLRGDDVVKINLPKDFIFQVNDDAEKGEAFMTPMMPVVVDQVMPGEGAAKAKLTQGDSIIAVDGEATIDYYAFSAALEKNKGKEVKMTYYRDGKELTTPVQVNTSGIIGINLKPLNEIYQFETRDYSLLASVPRGIEMGWNQLYNYVAQLKYIFTKRGAESIGGFGAIGSIFPDTWNWHAFWNITALISIILAFMNILPIPALDGGHVLFLIYEMIFRRKPSDKFLERAQMVGMVILFALLIYANGNDLWRWVIKPFVNQ